MSDFVINDEQPMRGTLIDAIRVIREYINRPLPPENTLIGNKTGTIIAVDDAFPNIPKGAKVYGKSTQDGTPTPDEPVPIMSVDDLTLRIYGKNIFDATLMKDQTAWNVIRVYAPVGTTLIMSTNYPQTGDMPCYFRQPSSSQSTTNYVYSGHPVIQTVGEQGYVEVVQRRASGTDSFSNYQWQIEVGSSATNYEPYVGTTIPVPLDNHILRSLPDGTCDELTFTYIEPSEREGWGVFGMTLVQRTNEIDLGDCTWNKEAATNSTFYASNFSPFGLGKYNSTLYCTSYIRSTAVSPVNMPDNSCAFTNSESTPILRVKDLAKYAAGTAQAFKANVTGVKLVYILKEQQTHNLGTIELPTLPAPNFTFFASGGNAQPDVQISYERDITIVIDKLEVAETAANILSISPIINHTIEPTIEPAILQEETE